MRMRSAVGCVALAAVLGGCNTVYNRTTSAGKPVVLYSFGTFQRNCAGGALPDASVSSEPANGTVSHSAARSALQGAGWGCDGKLIDYRVSTYTPRSGFRGQDKMTIKYDFNADDGPGRATRSWDFIVDVK